MCISFSFFNVTNVGTELQREAITGVTHVSVFRVGKPCTVGIQLLTPWRAETTAVCY